MTKFLINVLIGSLLAVARISGDKSELFQAIAHLFVGGWIGVAFVGYCYSLAGWKNYAILAFLISLVELIAFLAGIGK